MGTKGWTQHTDRRGVRLLTEYRKGGLQISDLREFLIEADKVGMTDAAEVRYSQGSLGESGSRTYELSASEDYEPDPAARPERAATFRFVRPYGITNSGVMTYVEAF
jgi:hypothetical protein